MLGVKANSVAVLGKAPFQGDFIRWNAADPVSSQFHKWLEEGHEAVRRSNLTLPAEPICFVYTAAGGRQALVGMMGPSTDKVGRQFPLTVYVPVDLGPVSGNAATLYGSHQAFFDGARQLLADAAKLSADELAKRAETLGAHASGDSAAADTYRRRALAAPASSLTALFTQDGGAAFSSKYYAFRTFMMACAAERGKEPTKPGVTLDCPFPEAVGPYPWVEMARRMLQWRGMMPALFWHAGPQPRLLVSLGPPSSTLLLHLAKPDHSSMKLWPLRTKAANAIETAKQALNANQRRALDDEAATTESLILAFSS
jgi:type VI secretion system protein ImpM